MKCYNHHDRDAFGVCRACGKGLCLECLKETEQGYAVCKNNSHCEEVVMLSELGLQNIKNFYSKRNGNVLRFLSIVCLLIGGTCGVIGLSTWKMPVLICGFILVAVAMGIHRRYKDTIYK